MTEQTLELPDGTAVRIRTEDAGTDRTATGGWLAERLCSVTPKHPDRIEVAFGAPNSEGVASVTVTLVWDQTPEPPPVAPPRVVTQDPPGLVIPPQRPGAAPPGLPLS
jgi:hypothetical protein